MLTVLVVTDTDNYPILREEVEAAMKSLKKGRSPRIDNIAKNLVQAEGDAVISTLYKIYSKVYSRQERGPYRGPSLLSHPSQERQPSTVQELPYDQPNLPPK